ncbi:hypothetical protein [Calidifontibacillus oryziterrae]|uniref:hypothetical protein n=1 Tax=Calidifontibacillus oryziterrae TaxID=1191699 RepID=UPI00030398CD|nr:hypothetical protein [Calidifontibacillus oryziterrae]
MDDQKLARFFEEKINLAKIQFERTVECKHTEFDDLYPYMSEQPTFFWYKRYVAWQELLTIVKLAEELHIEWKTFFTTNQLGFIEKKVLDAKVLDEWFEECCQES